MPCLAMLHTTAADLGSSPAVTPNQMGRSVIGLGRARSVRYVHAWACGMPPLPTWALGLQQPQINRALLGQALQALQARAGLVVRACLGAPHATAAGCS